jgi:hypothetical protein
MFMHHVNYILHLTYNKNRVKNGLAADRQSDRQSCIYTDSQRYTQTYPQTARPTERQARISNADYVLLAGHADDTQCNVWALKSLTLETIKCLVPCAVDAIKYPASRSCALTPTAG